MSVYVIKTIDGAEIVGKVDPSTITDTQVLILDPLEIRYKTGIDGYSQASMMKYNFFGDAREVRINKTSIITVYTIAPEYEVMYEKSIDSIEESMKKHRANLLSAHEENSPSSKKEDVDTLVENLIKQLTSNNTVH